MLLSTARFETPHASRYIAKLCKHFGHKVEASYDETRGFVVLPPGSAELHADETGLTIMLKAECPKDVVRARYIIDSHLVTFAHRENFMGLTWRVEPS